MTTAVHGAASRKARGAFFTPAPIAQFITTWAVRGAGDVVLDPSCGDAAFLVPGVVRLRELGSSAPEVAGVEIDPPSAALARERVEQAGGRAAIEVGDFFGVPADPRYDAVVGNPPYIRYQGFKGQARAAARNAAARGGVALTALASSWAPFVVHAAQFLRPGGRLGFVLPAELLSVNYAGPVRRFLFQSFGCIELVLFERQIFAEAEADTLILLAEDFGGQAGSATVRQVASAAELEALGARRRASVRAVAGFAPGAAAGTAASARATRSAAPGAADDGGDAQGTGRGAGGADAASLTIEAVQAAESAAGRQAGAPAEVAPAAEAGTSAGTIPAGESAESTSGSTSRPASKSAARSVLTPAAKPAADVAAESAAQPAESSASSESSGPGWLAEGFDWRPANPAEKWTDALVAPLASAVLSSLVESGQFARLDSWGPPKLGAVTGNNRYFTMSPSRARELGLSRRDLARISPAGSAHLRGLELSQAALAALGRDGGNTRLFRPAEPLSKAAGRYVEAGLEAGVDEAYKCRVRTPWYRVPLLEAPDLFLTCMNADTPRLTTNSAGVHHLNSVHGVYLKEGCRELGRELLPLASLNSATMLSAEVTGRSYGGGILKLEPGEAARWAVPSADFVASGASALRSIRQEVAAALKAGRLEAAVALVDQALLVDAGAMEVADVESLRQAWRKLAERRARRGRKNG